MTETRTSLKSTWDQICHIVYRRELRAGDLEGMTREGTLCVVAHVTYLASIISVDVTRIH